MIRKMEKNEIDKVMELWYIGNLEANSFVDKKYWRENFKEMERVFQIATVYVYKEKNEILGFVSMMESEMFGIFVDDRAKSKGIGKVLLDYAKLENDSLSISILEKNVAGFKFFKKQGFKLVSEVENQAINEKEFVLNWKK